MSKNMNQVEMLDRTLTELELLILGATDTEILSETQSARQAASDVEVLVHRALVVHAPHLSQQSAPARRLKSTGGRRKKTVSDDFSRRLQLLRRIAEMRPDLSPQISAVFDSGRTPTNEEFDALIEELVRLGALTKDEKLD